MTTHGASMPRTTMVCETCIHDTHLSNEYGSSQLAALETNGNDELSIEPMLSFHGLYMFMPCSGSVAAARAAPRRDHRFAISI